MEKIIFWDWTGTLADESHLDQAVCASMEQEIARRQNISFSEAERRYQEYLKERENTWHWHDYVTHGRDFGVDWKACQEKNFEKLVLVPEAVEILTYTHQKGFRNILATNAVSRVVHLRVAHAGLEAWLDMIIASDDVQALKSAGKHFRLGLETFNGSARQSYSVGDNPIQDIRPAISLGMRTVFCGYGKRLTHYHSRHLTGNHEERVASHYRIDSLQEMKDIL